MTLRSIEDVLMVCDTCGSTFRLGDCEAKDAYDHPGPYEVMARMTRAEYDKRHYDKIKADPLLYDAYLARKRREVAARGGNPRGREYERQRKAKWRARHPEVAQRIRAAGHAIEEGIRKGILTRPGACQNCASGKYKIEAHHHKGYQREHWLDVAWLCPPCHRKADRLNAS